MSRCCALIGRAAADEGGRRGALGRPRLGFSTGLGGPLDAANVRRAFRRIARGAGLDAEAWTPRELRHSFVSLLSSTGLAIEDISHLMGHANTRVSENVYRKELRPVLTRGAGAMDALFARNLGKQIG